MVKVTRRNRKSKRSTRRVSGGSLNPEAVTVLTPAEIDSMLETLGLIMEKYDAFKQRVRERLGGIDVALISNLNPYMNRETDEIVNNGQIRLNLLVLNNRVIESLVASLQDICSLIPDIQHSVSQLQHRNIYE